MPPDLIDTQEALDRVVEELSRRPALALDTESDAFHAYRPRICLVQVSVPGRDLLIDTLAGLDLDAFGAVLGDPEREVVLHAAENDVIGMHHEYGWRLPGLFDTQVASFVLGIRPYSLAGILEARFDVRLDKSEQRSDWSKRPLTERQIRYAAEDTHHLLDLARGLRERAESEGRLEEVLTECRRIAAREWEPDPFDPEGFRKLAGARDLDGVELRILRDLYLLRNREAERRNLAPFRIAGDSVLVTVARNRATSAEQGGPKGFWRRYGKRVEGIVRQAESRGELSPPPRKRSRGTPTPPEVKRDYEALRRWRAQAAEERGVESFVVARNELLMKIAASRVRSSAELEPLLEPFRFREYGEAMLAVLRKNSENS